VRAARMAAESSIMAASQSRQETVMRRPTIKDVAERAKVSLKTVSRVINNEPSVMQATRARVLRAVAELDYEPDPSARNLRSNTTFVIGLVYDNPNPYHIIGVQNGVLSACRETGFGLQIHPCDSTSPMLAEELADWVQRSRLAGLVLTAPMSERPELVAALNARGIKTVRIIAATEDPADGACVFVDDRDAAYEITEHLIQLGHQRIGFLDEEQFAHEEEMERQQVLGATHRRVGVLLERQRDVQPEAAVAPRALVSSGHDAATGAGDDHEVVMRKDGAQLTGQRIQGMFDRRTG